jgi:hypothetical protein
MPTPPSIRFNSSGTYSTLGTFDEVTGTIITNGLVSYFDAGRVASYPGSGTTWFDVPGSRNATLINGPVYNSTFSGILSFSAASSRYATFSPVGLPSGASAGSMEAWVRPLNQSVGSGFQLIASYGNAAISQARCIGYNVGYWFWAGYGNDVTFTQTITTNTWYHLVGTYDGITAIMYLNGTQVASSAKTWNTVLNAATLGAQVGPSDYLTGDIGYTAIYNRALAPYEVVRNYNAARPRFFNVSSGTNVKAKLSSTFQYYNSLDEITYNPNNGIASNNLLSHSQFFTSTNWTPGNATISLNTLATTAPDGTFTAAKLIDIAGAGQHTLSYNTGFVYTTGTVYTFSVYAKAAEISSLGVYIPGGNAGAKYNISTGALISNDSGITSTMTFVGNGWWKIVATYTSTLAATISPIFYMMNPSTSYTAVGGQGLYLWGAQFESGTGQGVYVATTASNVKFTTFAARTTNQGEIYVKDSFDEVTGMINTTGLIASWDASRDASYPRTGVVWTDISGNLNDVTLSGTYTYNTSTSFNMLGTGNAIRSSNTLNGLASSSTEWTVSVWFNYTSTATYTAAFEKQSAVGGGSTPRLDIGYIGSGSLFYFTTYNHTTLLINDGATSINLSANRWYNFTGVATSGVTRGYLNGNLIISSNVSSSWPDASQTLGIGGAQRKINGQIGETQVYNRALSATEVLWNFENTRTRYGV